MASLDSAFAKMNRGEELVNAVRDEIADFLGDHPEHVKVCRDPDQLTDRFLWNVGPPPTRIALLLGDAIHNYRSSLDHLVWALSVQSGNKISSDDAKDIQFPIASTENDWKAQAATKIKHVVPGSEALIDLMQPYHGTDTGIWPYPPTLTRDPTEYHALAILNRWDKIDKHRNLHTVFFNPYGVHLTNTRGGRLEGAYPADIELGTEVGRLVYDSPPSHSEMDVDPVFPGDIAIREKPPTWGLSRSLEPIRIFLWFRLEAFKRFF